MDLEQGLLTRRSIRQFIKGEKVKEADLHAILRAGMYAPSAMNRQPWEFVVVTDAEKLIKIMEAHQY